MDLDLDLDLECLLSYVKVGFQWLLVVLWFLFFNLVPIAFFASGHTEVLTFDQDLFYVLGLFGLTGLLIMVELLLICWDQEEMFEVRCADLSVFLIFHSALAIQVRYKSQSVYVSSIIACLLVAFFLGIALYQIVCKELDRERERKRAQAEAEARDLEAANPPAYKE